MTASTTDYDIDRLDDDGGPIRSARDGNAVAGCSDSATLALSGTLGDDTEDRT